jgi:plastocyanin
MTRARPAAIALAVLLAAPVAAGAAGGTVKGTITASGGPVANAVVLVEAPPAAAPPSAAHVVVEQRHMAFMPHVVAVAVGTTVDFPNRDRVLHNVFSTSPAKRFDLGMLEGGETKGVTFDAPGIVRVLCNVHPTMEAFVVVHTSPHAAVTDARGIYTLTGVPAGHWPVRVWHESLAEGKTEVMVQDGQVAPLDLRLEGH